MVKATMFEAKTKLSELVKKAQAGEEVILTSGREKKPVAKIVPVEPKKPKRLGAMYDPNFTLGDAFWESLPEEELRLWNGEGEDDLLDLPLKQTTAVEPAKSR
jgi:prevent-host-death family protein